MTADGPRPSIPVARYGDRLGGAQEALRRSGDPCILVGVGSDLVYLTGYGAIALERLTMLVLPATGRPILVAPRLETMAASGSPAASADLVDVVGWDETDDPYALVASVLAPAVGAASASGRILVSDRLWAMHVLGLERSLASRPFALATEVLRDLRMTKDPEEIALLRLAARAADRAVARIAGGSLVGRTEADVSREVREVLRAEGHDEAVFAIVGSGPNSASPHHDATERVIQAGEPIVLDIGGTLGGYGSDITRTLWVTGGGANGPTEEFVRIFSLVREAQSAATRAVRPGVSCEAIDAVARGIITDGGHGDDFFHRVGHGIGLEGHEDPYLVAGNAQLLGPGMAFSIEPGIYLAGRHGCRIEDIVVCGADGPDVLNEAPRDLWVVEG